MPAATAVASNAKFLLEMSKRKKERNVYVAFRRTYFLIKSFFFQTYIEYFSTETEINHHGFQRKVGGGEGGRARLPSRVAPTGGGKGGRGDPSSDEKAAIVAEEVWGMEVAERKRNRRMAVARSVVQGPN